MQDRFILALFISMLVMDVFAAPVGTIMTTETYVDGAVDAKQDKLTCIQGVDSAEHTDSNCLIWNFGN